MASLKASRSLLASAARMASTATAIFIDPDAAALRLYLNITGAAAGSGIAPVIRGYDKISGGRVELSTGGVPVSQVGTYAYEMCFAPDPPFGNIREAVSRTVPYQWDVIVKHFDGLSYTYSLSAEILR
jgi:hypothetical protein